MGRRLNHATPTVINTELVPLDESFYIEASGELEQWYYDNSKQFAPNRVITPLTLTPVLSVFDKDTSTSYTPAFYTTRWFVNEYDATQGEYVEREIVSAVDGSSPEYIISGDNLLVKKNVSYTRSVTIRCEATYIDPRDSGVTYTTSDSVMLTCNQDATVVFPDVAITSPKTRSFNPLTDYKTVDNVEVQDSQFDFDATITNNPEVEEQANDYLSKYEVDGGGTEELVAQDNSITSAPTMQIRYPDGSVEQDATFVKRATAGGTKPTLSGEAVMDSMKGNTVKWNQLIQNGNFSNGTNNWGGNLTVSNGVACLTQTSAYAGAIQGGVAIALSHFYYVSMLYYGNDSTLATGWKVTIGNTGNSDYVDYNVPAVSTSKKTLKKILQYKSSIVGNVGDTLRLSIYNTTATPGLFYFTNVQIFDLTLMFGAGNEPSTVEEFESWLDANVGTYDYYPYNEGSLIPVNIKSIKSESFNIWDEQWEVGVFDSSGNKIVNNSAIRSANAFRVIPNATYYAKFPQSSYGWRYVFYNANMDFVSSEAGMSTNATFTIPSNVHYMKFGTNAVYGNTYNHDICINLSDPNRDGTYKPHILDNIPFDITQIKGKLLDASGNPTGNSVVVFPDGLKKAGTVFDEIFVENGVLKAIKRVGSVDLGTINYEYNSRNRADTGNVFRTQALASLARNTGFILSAPFMYHFEQAWELLAPMEFEYVVTYLVICHTAATVANLKTALSGVIMYYELKTPQTYVLDPVQNPFIYKWFGISNGQEVDATTMPWYVSGQNTSKLKVDAMFGESINVVLRAQMPDGALSPSKAYASVEWRIPDVDIHVLSNNGGAVRSDTTTMTFDTVANVKGDVLADARKQQHLRFNWKYRKNNNTTENDAGWGNSVTINASNLRNVKGASSTLASTLVYPYVYVLGAWQTSQGTITGYDKPTLEKDGVTYYRIIDD